MYFPMFWNNVECLGSLAIIGQAFSYKIRDGENIKKENSQPRMSRTDLLSGRWEGRGKALSIQDRSEDFDIPLFQFSCLEIKKRK